jgi:hypothetical protein
MHARESRSVSAAVIVTVGVLAGALALGGCTEPAPSVGGATVPLTTAQLKALTFKDGEVPQAYPGGIDVSVPSPGRARSSYPPVSDAACQTVIDVRSGRQASAVVSQIFNWKDDVWPGGSILAAYPDGVAESAFKQLREALGSCRSYVASSSVGTFEVRLTLEPSPRVGDDAVGFHELVPMTAGSDRDRDEHFVVVRAGSTIVTFTTLNSDTGSSFPPDLIDKQVRRLQDAQRKH